MKHADQQKRPDLQRRPVEAEGVPDGEDLDPADVADRVDEEPEDQVNRTDQADFPVEGERPFRPDLPNDGDPDTD